MRDMDLKLLEKLTAIIPDSEPETVEEPTRNIEEKKTRRTKK